MAIPSHLNIPCWTTNFIITLRHLVIPSIRLTCTANSESPLLEAHRLRRCVNVRPSMGLSYQGIIAERQ
jgi:hypothetical protein